MRFGYPFLGAPTLFYCAYDMVHVTEIKCYNYYHYYYYIIIKSMTRQDFSGGRKATWTTMEILNYSNRMIWTRPPDLVLCVTPYRIELLLVLCNCNCLLAVAGGIGAETSKAKPGCYFEIKIRKVRVSLHSLWWCSGETCSFRAKWVKIWKRTKNLNVTIVSFKFILKKLKKL